MIGEAERDRKAAPGRIEMARMGSWSVPEETIKNNFRRVTQPFDGRLTSQAGTGVRCQILVLFWVASLLGLFRGQISFSARGQR